MRALIPTLSGQFESHPREALSENMDPIDPSLGQWLERQLSRRGQSTHFQVEPLNVEASHRRFYRINSNDDADASLVAMSSPPALENNVQFETLASVFARFGVSVPQIIASDPAAGWYLLTDLGSQHLEDVYGSPQAEAALDLAIDTLLKIQGIDDPAVQPYTPQRFHDELEIFHEWFVEAWLQMDFPTSDLAGVFADLVANTQRQQQCCVHRDFHCRNLLVQAESLGVVDFQDALLGPISYDLASLLRDCYYRFSEAEIDHWRDAYLHRAQLSVDPANFAADVDLMAVQRQLKAVGIFARLQLRDGKTSHLQYIPSVLQHIQDVATHYPLLQPLCRHLSTWQTATVDRLAHQ